MSWIQVDGMVTLAEVPVVVGTTELSTTFTAPALTQYLEFAWDDSTGNGGFDVEVTAAVPVPAAGLMLVTALAGAAALRRRA